MHSEDPSFQSLLLAAMESHVAAARRLSPGKMEAEKIHLLRTGIKRLRAYWRLLRPLLPASRYRRENQTLKHALHTLAPLRETDALRITIKRFAEKSARKTGRKQALRHAGWTRLAASLPSPRGDDKARGKILRLAWKVLTASLERFAQLDVEPLGNQRLRALLKIACRKARKAGRNSESGGVAALHVWRKRVKDHEYQLQALEPLLAQRSADVLKNLDRLQGVLGDAHDVAVLKAYVRDRGGRDLGPKTARILRITLDHKLARLRKKSEIISRANRSSP